MADTAVSITNQNAQGVAPIDVKTVTTGAGTVGRETVVIGDPTTGANVASVTAIGLSVDTTVSTQDLNITGQTGQSTAGNNIILAAAGTAATDCTGYRGIALQIITTAGITAGVISFEGSNDNTNFVAIALSDEAAPTADPVTTITLAASTSRFMIGPLHFRYFRARISTAVTGGTVSAVTRLLQTAYSEDQVTVTQSTAALLNVTATVSGVAAVGVQGGTTGRVSAPSRLSAASTATGVIKASGTNVYSLALLNTTASIRYFHIYNKATAPTIGTDTPLATFGIPANGALNITNDLGYYFVTAASYGVTTDNAAIPATVGATGDVIGTIIYY